MVNNRSEFRIRPPRRLPSHAQGPQCIGDIMTRRPLTLPVHCTVGEALAAAARANVHHVMLTRLDRFVGVACVCTLRDHVLTESLLVAVPPRTFAVQAESPLWIARRRFEIDGVHCLPVFEGASLVGVLTRGDLRRRGAVQGEEALELPACDFCGEGRHVRPHPGQPGLHSCLDCAERSRNDLEYDVGVAH